MTTKLDAPYTTFTLRATSQASRRNGSNVSKVRGPTQIQQGTGNAKLEDTSPTNATTNASTPGLSVIDFHLANTLRLQIPSPCYSNRISSQMRPFSTGNYRHTKYKIRDSLLASFGVRKQLPAVPLLYQLRNRRIPAVAVDDVENISSEEAKKIASLRPKEPDSEREANRKRQIQILRSIQEQPRARTHPSDTIQSHRNTQDATIEQHLTGGGRLRSKRLRRQQTGNETSIHGQPRIRRYESEGLFSLRRVPVHKSDSDGGAQEQPRIRKHAGKAEKDLSPEVHMLLGKYRRSKDLKTKAKPEESTIFEYKPQLQEEKRRVEVKHGESRMLSCEGSTDPNWTIKFIPDKQNDYTRTPLSSEPESVIPKRIAEQNLEPIEVRRHLSMGKAPKPRLDQTHLIDTDRIRLGPAIEGNSSHTDRIEEELGHLGAAATNKNKKDAKIRYVPAFAIKKHIVGSKRVFGHESNILIKRHTVGEEAQENAHDLLYITRGQSPEGAKAETPRDRAKKLHSTYSLTALH